VRRVAADLERRLASPLRQAVTGSLSRATRTRRPRHAEIDWHRTIRANLRHYQPSLRTVVPEVRLGYGRKRGALRDVILCVDQSGSMASSVVYAGVFGSVLASLNALSTRVVVYDTSVVDLTENLSDPVDVLFGTQLGGGNDTPRALEYVRGLVRRPQDTILVLISDLYEGAQSEEMLRRLGAFHAAGVQVISLLALDDEGRPSYDHHNGAALAAMGIPVFGCTPDAFPELMAAAIERRDLNAWAAARGIVSARAVGAP
jgi:Mg-chelatase subunit ChlD